MKQGLADRTVALEKVKTEKEALIMLLSETRQVCFIRSFFHAIKTTAPDPLKIFSAVLRNKYYDCVKLR